MKNPNNSLVRQLLVKLLAVVLCFSAGLAARAASLVQEFYLPMPEAQIYQANNAIISGAGSTINSTFSIVVTGNGTVIYYDQWEDGYETDLGNPTQSTTQIWGDGNDAHGIPPGFAHNPLGLAAGTVITLTNNVPLPRNPSTILWDGRDRIGANKALIISRAAWPIPTGPVFAGAASVLSTIDYGTNFVSPVGQNQTNVNLFKYVGMFIMASQNNTVVTIDPNGTGVGTTNIVLNQGESYLVNGGIMTGGRVTSTKPIQADLIVGHVGASYASDWFTLYPVGAWSSSYYTPVGSAAKVSQPAYAYIYNPNATAITINYTTKVGSGSFSVPGTNGVYQFQMPVSSGASFVSAGGQSFYALCTVAANNSSDTSYNWGFTLVPQGALTTEADLGWAPGSADGTVNGSPVWVTALANTTLYVDYKGDHLGSLTDPNGNKYDTNFTVTALQSQKIFDPSKNQTGMRVYTVDGTLITAAWGEDPDTAQPGDPYIDAGTTVLPFPVPMLKKTAVIVSNTGPAGLSIGDIIQYTVQVDNKGLLPLGNTVVIDAPSGNLTYVSNSTTFDGNAIPDHTSGSIFPLSSPGYNIPVILSQGTSTFQYLAQVNAGGMVSNSVNIGGTTISSQASISPPPTNGASVTLKFTDNTGVTVPSYSVGGNVYVTMTNAAGNTASNSVQTISITVVDQNTGDLETIILTETGTNTGVFRNTAGLVTSSTSGLSQQDSVLNVAPGDTLKVSYTDPNFGDSDSTTALISFPTPNKQLYLSANGSTNGTQALNRIDPVAYGHTPTRTSVDIGSATGTVTFDARAGGATTSTNRTLTISHTTGSGTNRLMIVGISFAAAANDTTLGGISNVVYGSSNLTKLTTIGDTADRVRTELWYLLNPASGAANVVVNMSNTTQNIIADVTTFASVNQSTPFGPVSTSQFGSSTFTTATNVVSSATGDLVFQHVGFDGNGTTFTLSSGAGQTLILNTNSQFQVLVGASYKAGAASVTNTWTISTARRFAAAAVSVKAAAATGGSSTNVTSFSQTPAFASPFTIPAGGTVTITNFITITNGSLSSGAAVTATLRYNGTNIITLSNPTYSAASNTLVWSSVMASNVTIPAGQLITCTISNNVVGTVFHINYDSTTAPSVIVLPASASTVIQLNTLGVYDAAYTNGNLVSSPVAGSTIYVRAVISDPFGSYDITSLDLAVTGPSPASSFTNNLTASNVVASDTVSKTYEYAWSTGPTTGGYNIAVTAHEGTEGVTAVGAAGITTTFLDLGTPSSTSFVTGVNRTPTNSYTAGSPVCISVTALDSITNAAIIQTIVATITSSAGDSEAITLTETAANSGVYTSCINTSTNAPGTTNNGTLYAPVGSVLTATYTDPHNPSYSSSATATIQPPPGVPGVAISKTILSPSGGQVGIGQAITFNLQVVNSGSTTLPNMSVSDTYSSAALSYSTASLTPSTTSSGLLIWTNLGAFAPGQSTNITVTFTTLAPGTATNRAAANGVSITNTSSVTVLVNKAALNVTKTLLSPTNQPIAVGSNLIFRITVQNVGNTVVNYLPLEDTFSGAYYQFVSATIPPNGSGSGSLLWTNLATNSLGTNATITNDITMKVVGQGSPANNSATVDYATDVFGNAVPTSSSTIGVTTASASINGHVYNDTNQSGVFNVGDPDLSGVTLQLFTDPNGDGNPSDGVMSQIVTTDGNGYYELLNLNTGHYVVVETLLPGYAGSAPANNRIAVNVTNLTAYTNQNFFQYVPAPSVYSTISGTVWNDVNANGAHDGGEIGIANVEIDLMQDANTNGLADSGEPVVASVTTDTNGNYSFAGVTPGHYIIRESDPFGYYSVADSQPPNNNQITFTSTNGIVSTNNNFFDRQSPVAVNDTNTTVYFVPVTIRPLTNDLSPYGDVLTITNVTSPDGLVTFTPGGTNLTFTPTNTGSTTVYYTIADAHGGTSTGTISVGVSPAPLSVTASNASRAFGQPNPTFTGSLVGVTNGDNITATFASAATTNSPVGTYTIVPTPVDPNNRLTNYSVTLNNGTLTVSSASTVVTWTNPIPVIYGTPLSSNQLNATANVPGTFVYTPTNGTVLNVGTNTLSVIFTPTDALDYTSATNTVSLVVQPAPLSITANSTNRLFGQNNPAFTGSILGVTNGDNITATYASSAVSNSPAGTYSIIPTPVDPNHRLTNYTVSLNNGTLTVSAASSLVTWANPIPVLYGTALSSNQLNASANVPGTFVYTPTNGTILNVGTNTLSTVFTPTDTLDYKSATNTVTLVVQPAPLTITANSTNRAFGQNNPAFTGSVVGVTNGDNITATYASTATTNSAVGTYSIVPTPVDPNSRLTNYTLSLNNGTLTVSAASSLVTWTNPVPVIYGTALSSNQLNASANVPGTFAYAPTNGTVLNVGTNTLSTIFTPSDTLDYKSATNTVTLVVQPAPLTITANSANRIFGQNNPAFTGSVVGVTNGDNITATYTSTATSNSPVGNYSIVPTPVDPNSRLTNYSITLNNGTLTVSSAASIVTWTNPIPVVYGTALSSNQLNATANVPGTFVYTPTNGTVLNVGTNTLSTVFTPADTLDYKSATNTVTLVVQPAPLTITANSTNRAFGQNNPTFTGTIVGVTNGDNITATYASTATSNSPAGPYSIVPTPVDPNHRLTNYSLTLNNGTLTVSAASSLVTWTNPIPVIYGTALSSNQLNASANVPGTFVYTPTNGTVPNVGSNTLSTVFTPTDTLNYKSATNTVTLVVQPAPLTITANSTNRTFGQNNPTFTGSIVGVTNGDNITTTYASTATSNSPAGNYSIVPSPVDPNHRLTNYSLTLNNGTLTVSSASSLVTWITPAPIIYGTPLSSNQLNATATVLGTFVYSPTNGVVLNVGTNTLSVVFTPTDTVNYNISTNFVSLVVQPAPLTVTANNTNRAFGQNNPAFTGSVVGVTNGDNITATYASAATTNSPVGPYFIIPSLVDPNNRLSNYTFTLNNGTLTVSAASSLVTWTNPIPVIYGTALSSNQLNASANVPGTFVYTPTNGTVLNVGTNTLSTVFTPTDTLDYKSATNTVSLVVQPAPLTVTANSTNRIFGQTNPAFTGSIVGVTNGDSITATYASAATTNSPVGIYSIIPSLVDPNSRLTNYTFTLNNGTLTVSAASSLVTWTNPIPVIYGTALSSNQLNASANVPGTFVYTPTNGTVLNVGTNTLSTVFTPTDTLDYKSATNTVTLVVQPAPLTITANNTNRAFGQNNPAFTGSIVGVTNGDNITATFASTAISNSPAGTYFIIPTPMDPNHRLTNYSLTLNNGTLTVSSTSSLVTWTNPIPVIYGTPLSSNQLNATATVGGAFVYSPTNGTVLNMGTNTLSVVFTPTDTVNYNTSTNVVSLVVQPAPLTITTISTNRVFGQNNPAFTGSIVGVTNGDNITATFASAATSNSPVGNYSIVPTPVDPNHRLTNYALTLNNGTLSVSAASSLVTWTNPLPVVYGTPLSSIQLNASANVPGTFAYTPAAGVVLNVGTNTLSTVFTPTDTLDYKSATNTVTLVVQPAPLTVTANNASRAVGASNPAFTGTLTGVTNSDNITATYASSATTNSPAGTYAIVPTLVDPNLRLTNYIVASSNGTLSVTAVADIVVILSGPSTITAGSNFTYTIVVNNLGPSTATNIVLTDHLPGVVTFVSASSGGSNNSGTVTWPAIASLTNGGVATFSLVVQAPGSGSFTNSASALAGTFDPNLNNNNGTGAASQAGTTVLPPSNIADIAVITTGPTNVVPGQTVTYTILVTNMGPATATGVVLTDTLPTNVTFVSLTGGGTNAGGTVTWSLGSLTNGQATNVIVIVTAPTSGSFVNAAAATSSSVDPNVANNNGSAAASQVATAVVPAQFGVLAGAAVLNAQTGLYEEKVVVTNISAATVLGVRLYVDGLRTGIQLYNASGTNAGRPYAQYNSALNPNQTVTFTLEFFVPDRRPFTNSLDAEAFTNPLTFATNAAGSTSITRVFMDSRTTGAPRFVIEFNSVPGKSYTIIYSDDNMATWKAATPSVTASANSTQWYDDGPPETDSAPSTLSTRFYAIIVNP